MDSAGYDREDSTHDPMNERVDRRTTGSVINEQSPDRDTGPYDQTVPCFVFSALSSLPIAVGIFRFAPPP